MSIRMVLLPPLPPLIVFRFTFTLRSDVAALLLGSIFLFLATAAHAQSSSSASSAPDIQIFVTDGKNTVKQGGSLIYVLELRSPTSNQELDVTLELPLQADTISPDNGGRVIGKMAKWDRVMLTQNQTKRLTVQANLVTSITEGTVLRAIARAGNNAFEDETTVLNSVSNPDSVFEVFLTDERATAQPGQKLRYTAVVRNVSSTVRTADVTLNMPVSLEIDEIDPDVSSDSSAIVWNAIRFEPGQVKTFAVTATVRRNVTEFVSLLTTIEVGGVRAQDTTVVQKTSQSNSSASSARNRSSSSSSRRTASRNLLFVKSANASEVMPGGTIRYTLRVQNVLLTVIDDAVITDRFDPAMMTAVDLGGGRETTPGQLRWIVPRLQPGMTWQTTYVLAVHENVPAGTDIGNVATIAGTDVATATLNEKVNVVRTGIVDSLPKTGVSYDGIFLLLSGIASLGVVAGTKKCRK